MNQRQTYLQTMGIQSWVIKEKKPVFKILPISTPDPHFSKKIEPCGDIWQVLIQVVNSCQRCELSQNRQQPIFGEGDQQASLLIITDPPNKAEDQAAQLLIEDSGQLFLNMLFALGLKRQQIYLTCGLKCQNQNKTLLPKSSHCFTWLNRQVELVQPQVILVLGQSISEQLNNYQQPFATLRKTKQTFLKQDIPMIVSYHPNDLLNDPKIKAKAWLDLQQLVPYLGS